jgi:hypothetical protein
MAKKKQKKVGYRNPPKKTQFKKGKSGNPKGRPKGSGSIKSAIFSLLQKKITAKENGKDISIPTAEAIARVISHKALKGDKNMIKIIIDVEKAKGLEENDEKTFEEWLDEIEEDDEKKK